MECRAVELEWDALAVPDRWDLFALAVQDKWGTRRQPGLYAIEGRHNAHPEGCVLYLGKTIRGGQELLDQTRSHFFRWKTPSRLYSSFWELSLRWSPLNPWDVDLLNDLESLMILSQKPPVNSQGVNRDLRDGFPFLVISNRGQKGRLLGMVHSLYAMNSNHRVEE